VDACRFSIYTVSGWVEAGAGEAMILHEMCIEQFWCGESLIANVTSSDGDGRLLIGSCTTAAINQKERQLRPYCALMTILENLTTKWTWWVLTV
jgi:hypothetical protein